MQEEYIECTQGHLGLEIEGREQILTPADGRYDIGPYVNHRSYPIELARQSLTPAGERNTVVKFLLSGEKRSADDAFELSPIFFENWYKYQDDVVMNGKWIDLIQVFCVGFSLDCLPLLDQIKALMMVTM